MTVTSRTIATTVLLNGTPIPYVLSASITRGLDQDVGTAQVTIPSPPPFTLNKFDWITIELGYRSGPVQRFAGYVVLPQINFWEPTITLQCEDVLALAKRFKPSEVIDFGGLTDQEIVTLVLDTIGIPHDTIGGTGKVISAESFPWSFMMSGLDVIKSVDGMSGSVVSGAVEAWRTFAGADGQVRRYLLTEKPYTTYSYLFQEGVNILEGTLGFEETDPSTQALVIGEGDIQSLSQLDADQIILNSPYWIKYSALKQQAASMGFASTEEVSAWLLAHLARDISHITFATQEDMQLDIPMTVAIVGDHFLIAEQQNLWLQSFTVGVDENDVFTQQCQLAGEIRLSLIGKLNPYTFQPVALATATQLAAQYTVPSTLSVFAVIAMPVIVKELVELDGVATWIYIVTVTSASYSLSGTITTLLWGASGTGLVPSTYPTDGPTYTRAFLSLADAVITLQATNSNGQTATATLNLSTVLVPVRVEKLYAGTPTQAWAFGGDQWRSHTPSNAQPITAIARRGPHYAAGDLHIATLDDFRTAGVETLPFGAGTGAIIRAIWKEPDVPTAVLDGASIASVARAAVSPTGTGSWRITANPGTDESASDIRAAMVSRFTPSQYHVLTDTGYYVSDNSGYGWRTIRLGDFVDFAFSHIGRNIVVTGDGHLERAEDGTRFTFAGNADPPAPLLCCTVHIKQDIQYALASDGTSWVTTTPGGWDMEQRESIPLGTPQLRGMDRSGLVVDKIYFAAGDGGLWETIDGFRTTDGFFKVRDGTI